MSQAAANFNDSQQLPQHLPLYKQIANALLDEVATGPNSGSQPLASEREIAEKHGVSRDTVRKAIQHLERQGVVYSEQGRGTFVAPPSVREMTRSLNSFSKDTELRGGLPGQIILSLEQIPASFAISNILGVPHRQMIWRLKRVRTVDNTAVGIQDSYITIPVTGKLSADDIVKSGSLYGLLAERFGLKPAEGLESLGATSASDEDAKNLGIEPGTPLLTCERITLTERRKPMEYCEMKYVSSYRYTVRIQG